MKKLIIFSLFMAYTFGLKAQTCKALFSYGAQFERVAFVNQSTVSNAHYFWNFGDGTGSNLINPTHEYVENGNYLVTLYADDTINNCSDIYELWLNITKYSTDLCVPSIYDSIYSYNSLYDYLKIKDVSINCGNYINDYRVGWCPFYFNATAALPKTAGNWLACERLGTSIATKRSAYKTCPNNFNRTKNYGACSANFEFKVVSEDSTSQLILFTAMNKNAKEYSWVFKGFGTPLLFSTDTASVRFTGNIYATFPDIPWQVYLMTVGQNGCRDSLYQNIMIHTKSFTYVGLKEQNQNEIKLTLIPNPVKDRFTLEYEQGSTEINKLTISNTLGQMVFILNEPKPGLEIDISHLTGGIYYLKAESKTDLKTFKVLKE